MGHQWWATAGPAVVGYNWPVFHSSAGPALAVRDGAVMSASTGPAPGRRGMLTGWLSVWSKAQIAYGPADATASHFIPFWYRLTQVVLEKRPLNGIVISV